MTDIEFSDAERRMILQAFVATCDDGFASMEQSLLALEANPGDEASLQEVFRVCHTLKGDALTLQLDLLASIAHAMEDILDRVRAGTSSLDRQGISLFLGALDSLRELVADAHLPGGASDPERHVPLLEGLRAFRDALDTSAGEAPQMTAAAADPEAAETDVRNRRRTFRVRVETVDRLLDLTGELAIARSRIRQLINANDWQMPSELEEAHDAVDQLSAELQQEVMKVRMVPVGALFKQHLRTVRDTGLALGKLVRMQTKGTDTELDTTVIEHLRDPLGHMIRNAIVHGIESAEERQAKGKDPCGTVTLHARHQDAGVVVEVEDDGAGLDLELIRQQAASRGLVAQPEKLSDTEAAALIFEPGLSTAVDTTLAAGRGVGMDVVRRNIEAIHGSVSVATTPGQGTVVSARLPLTLAIIDGFGVGIGNDVYVIPVNAVTECLDLPESGNHRGASSGVVNLRGAPLPFGRLGFLLDQPSGGSEREKIVVIRHGAHQVGLCVDALYGESQAVIKPLDPILGTLPGIAGSTILGDGRVALVLDVPSLLRRITGGVSGERFSGGNAPGAPLERPVA